MSSGNGDSATTFLFTSESVGEGHPGKSTPKFWVRASLAHIYSSSVRRLVGCEGPGFDPLRLSELSSEGVFHGR